MPLLLPNHWRIPKQLRQPQPLRLPPVEDRLDKVRREAGERQDAADEGAARPLSNDAGYCLQRVCVGKAARAICQEPALIQVGRL